MRMVDDTAPYDTNGRHHPDISLNVVGMKQRLHTYKAYSLGCVIVWAALLLAVAARRDQTTLHTALFSSVDIGVPPCSARELYQRTSGGHAG